MKIGRSNFYFFRYNYWIQYRLTSIDQRWNLANIIQQRKQVNKVWSFIAWSIFRHEDCIKKVRKKASSDFNSIYGNYFILNLYLVVFLYFMCNVTLYINKIVVIKTKKIDLYLWFLYVVKLEFIPYGGTLKGIILSYNFTIGYQQISFHIYHIYIF